MLQRLMELLHKAGLHGASTFTGRLWGEQAAVMKRMIGRHGAEVVEQAIRGTARLYPHSKGDPFNAFRVETKMSEALAQMARPEVKTEADEARENERVARHRERTSRDRRAEEAAHREAYAEWQARMRRRLMDEPREVQERYRDRAAGDLGQAAGFMAPEVRRRTMAARAFALYGQSVRDPAPALPGGSARRTA